MHFTNTSCRCLSASRVSTATEISMIVHQHVHNPQFLRIDRNSKSGRSRVTAFKRSADNSHMFWKSDDPLLLRHYASMPWSFSRTRILFRTDLRRILVLGNGRVISVNSEQNSEEKLLLVVCIENEMKLPGMTNKSQRLFSKLLVDLTLWMWCRLRIVNKIHPAGQTKTDAQQTTRVVMTVACVTW